MKKPESLLATLADALDAKHHVKGDSARLQMVLSNVSPQTDARPGAGFSLAYTVEINMPDFNGNPLEVIVPMLRWLERWQHDLVANGDKAAKAIDMTCIRLDAGRYDLHAAVNLTEDFRYVARAGRFWPGRRCDRSSRADGAGERAAAPCRLPGR